MSKKACISPDLARESQEAQERLFVAVQRFLERLEPKELKIVPQTIKDAERRLPRYKNGSGD